MNCCLHVFFIFLCESSWPLLSLITKLRCSRMADYRPQPNIYSEWDLGDTEALQVQEQFPQKCSLTM